MACLVTFHDDELMTLGVHFMQIHYDRIGKDGLFSHREVTVLYVPDISDCLPSLESWRDQWISHKRAVAERDRQLNLKREVRVFSLGDIYL